MAIIDSYSESNANSFNSPSASVYYGQSFTGNGSTLDDIQLYVAKNSSAPPSGDSFVTIYAHSGTYGTSSVGTGSPLATSGAVATSGLPTAGSPALRTWTFSGANRIVLANATNYVFMLELPGVTGNVDFYIDSSSPTHGGNQIFLLPPSSWFASSGNDHCFYVNGTAAATTLPPMYRTQQAVNRASTY